MPQSLTLNFKKATHSLNLFLVQTSRTAIKTLSVAIILGTTACSSSTPAPVYNAMIEQRDQSAGAHMVDKGESLAQIAKNYSMTIDDIMRANNLSDGAQIARGSRLFLPKGPTQGAYANASPMINTSAPSDFYNQVEAVEIEELQVAAIDQTPIQSESLAPLDSSVSSEPVAPLQDIVVSEPVPTPNNVPPKPPIEGVKTASIDPSQWADPVQVGFRMPVRGPIVSNYGDKANGLRNDGINIGASLGSAVESAGDGEVVYTGQAVEGFGNLILVKHKNNYVTAYGHLSRLDVKKGQSVRAGQIIGGVGQTGAVDSPQLHFEVRQGTKIINPESLLGNKGIIGAPKTASR